MDGSFHQLLEMALEEDLSADGDVTSEAVFHNETRAFVLVAKAEGIFCGQEVMEAVFHRVNPNIIVTLFKKDGEPLKPGDWVAQVEGQVSSILAAERTAINFIAFLSGIATATARLVAAAPSVTVLDTRKTLPGYRELSKYAVRCGGGCNHRKGLYDQILIKDNHIDAAGSIALAVERVRKRWGDRFPIEVETRTFDEVREAVEQQVDRIMLDNMSTPLMKRCVEWIHGRCETEASGNMTAERLEAVAAAGVDFVSFGSITHSVAAFDFSLRQLPQG